MRRGTPAGAAAAGPPPCAATAGSGSRTFRGLRVPRSGIQTRPISVVNNKQCLDVGGHLMRRAIVPYSIASVYIRGETTDVTYLM